MTSPRLILSILLGLCGSTLVNAAAAQAATVTVTTTADGGVGSLRDALAIAAPGDIIDASSVSGTITLTTGELLVTESLSIIGPGPDTLAVDGNDASRVFHIAPNTVVVISGLTITNGHAGFVPGFVPGAGSGILNDHASLTLINCTLHGNTALFISGGVATGLGGGIYNAGRGGSAHLRIVDSTLSGNSAFLTGGALFNDGDAGHASVEISNSTLSGNTARGFVVSGGAIHNRGISGGNATLKIVNSTLSGNSAPGEESDGGGGGIYNEAGFGTQGGSASVEIVNSTLSDNWAGESGGGLLNFAGNGASASVEIRNSMLLGNAAGFVGGGPQFVTFAFGGGIRNSAYGGGKASVRLVSSTLSANSAFAFASPRFQLGGGGVSNDAGDGSSASVAIVNSTVSGNSADSGGGLSNRGSGDVEVVNSTITGNSAILHGGGINIRSSSGSANVKLVNSTLSGNSVTGMESDSGSGGGVYSDGSGSVVLVNTILAGNTHFSSPDCAGPITSFTHNLIGDQTGCTITLQPTDLTGDPGLGAYVDDGTPGTGHLPLLPTSQAIDAGDAAVCPETDQLGQLRVGPCDIGAIEFQSSVPVDTRPPAISVSATPRTLWPPNGKLVTITVSGTIIDESFGSGVDVESAVYAVADEYGQIEPSGKFILEGDSYIFTVSLEASRQGRDGDGRNYVITVSATDHAGNVGRAATPVTVPHDRGQ